jgi:hypothetical protein
MNWEVSFAFFATKVILRSGTRSAVAITIFAGAVFGCSAGCQTADLVAQSAGKEIPTHKHHNYFPRSHCHSPVYFSLPTRLKLRRLLKMSISKCWSLSKSCQIILLKMIGTYGIASS